MGKDKQKRSCDADRKKDHCDSRGDPVIAMHHRNGDQRTGGLQQ
jgi:hypothetical protein